MATIIAQLLRSGRAWPELEFWEASATTTVSNIAGQCLPSIAAQGGVGDEVADEAQSQALRKGRMKKLKAFPKSPDRPPGEVIERRLRRRTDEIAC
jgi:hypothetical protein